MGSFLRKLFGWDTKISPAQMGPEADIPDPVSNMTPREVAYVQQSWDLARTDLKTHGTNFFLLLFKTYPVVQTRFTPFKGKPLEELAQSKRFQAHGTTFMTAIDSYVTNLDDVEAVVEMLKTTGQNHKNRGVEPNDFKLAIPVLAKYLKESIPASVWNVETEKSWKKLLDVVAAVVMSSYV